MSEKNVTCEDPQNDNNEPGKNKTISIFSHENALMHKDMDNERMHRNTLFVCLTVILLTVIFVVSYTVRMNSFINVIKEMNAALVQLANAKINVSP